MIAIMLESAPACAGRMRPEETVVDPFLLMGQFHGAPHYASTSNAQQRRNKEIGGEKRRSADKSTQREDPLPPVCAYQVFKPDDPDES